MVYTHLNQFQGFSHKIPIINSTCTDSAVTLPVTFVLPELITGNKDIDGRMPPSCGVGSAYIDPEGKTYMQPLIEYYLQITLRYRLPTDLRVRIVSTKRKIKITTSTHDDPPTYAQHSTKVQPAAMFADIRRSRFSKPFARLSLSMTEPLPVVRDPIDGSCQSTGLLHMTWSTSRTAYDEFELGRHPVRINYRLKARTRFSTRPIRSGSDCGKSTNYGVKPQTRVEMTYLATCEVRPTERDHVLLTTSEGWERSHTRTIPLPIRVLEGTIPTFSHLLASRDYTLLLNVSIQGLRHAALSLEVPLQICETLATCKIASTQVGSWPFANVLVAEVSQSSWDTSFLHRVSNLSLGTAKVRRSPAKFRALKSASATERPASGQNLVASK